MPEEMNDTNVEPEDQGTDTGEDVTGNLPEPEDDEELSTGLDLTPPAESSKESEGDEEEEKPEEEVQDPDDEGASPDDVRFGDLRKYDPELFKKFPNLQRVISEERQYREHFTNPEQARIASQVTDHFQDIMIDAGVDGNLVGLLKSAERFQPNGEAQLYDSENILTSLKNANPDAHRDLLHFVNSRTLAAFYEDAMQGEDINMQRAFRFVAKAIFGDAGALDNVGETSRQESALRRQTRERMDQVRAQQVQQAFQPVQAMAGQKLDEQITTRLKRAGLPDNQVNKSYVMNAVTSKLSSDQDYRTLMTRMHERAKKIGNYDQRMASRIISATLDSTREAMNEAVAQVRKASGPVQNAQPKNARAKAPRGQKLQGRGSSNKEFRPTRKQIENTSLEDLIGGRITN